MKTIHRLQFITHERAPISVLEECQQFWAAGGAWVQLRWKHASEAERLAQSKAVMAACPPNGIVIINDHIELAQQIGAHGVHLGKQDRSPAIARELLGPEAIIGATCNSYYDILDATDQPIDYIGLGPYRHTTTKENLSPILGIQGYHHIVRILQCDAIEVPLIAIGGIQVQDVAKLLKVGMHGIAVSSAISHAPSPSEASTSFLAEGLD